MENITMLNGFIAVILNGDKKTLGNGLTITETRGRRDIVTGTIAMSENSDLPCGSRVWFPLYAATIVLINGEPYHIVKCDDLMMVSR
jgi:co-chaperonin GroES (HSP10)